MTQRTRCLVVLWFVMTCACSPRPNASESATRAESARSQQASSPAQVTNEPAVASTFGTVPGRRTFDESNPEKFIREPGYPQGVFAVPRMGSERLLAFDADSIQTGICTRIDRESFELPNGGNQRYYRYRCEGSWSRNVVFVDATSYLPRRAEELKWQALGGDSPLAFSSGPRPADLHRHAAVASPKLLNGRVLVSAVWFTGEYPPRAEPDESRGDSIKMGHYRILDRALFIGQTPREPATFLYRGSEVVAVDDGLERAFLPEDASEKTRASFSAIYETPRGYCVRISLEHDHEGFGIDHTTFLYAYEGGSLRLLARAEYTHLY